MCAASSASAVTRSLTGKASISTAMRGWAAQNGASTRVSKASTKPSLATMRTLPLKDGNFLAGSMTPNDYAPISTEWLGRWRLKANESNDWTINRELQANNTIYTGIENIHLQDQAVTESMGGITDHDFEHLAPSDQMIARTRRRLLKAARAFAEKGTPPPGVDNPDVYLGSRSGYFVSDAGVEWLDAYEQQVGKAFRIASLLSKDEPAGSRPTVPAA